MEASKKEKDLRHEFEMWKSRRGEAALYEGDGRFGAFGVTEQYEAFIAGVEIGCKALASQAAPIPSNARPVLFMCIDPLNIGKGAVLPMVPDSWRMGFFTTGDDLLHFGYLDDGPLVAWEAVKDLIAPQSDCRKYCQREAEELSAPAPAVAVDAPAVDWITEKILSYTRPETPRDHEAAQRCARVIAAAYAKVHPKPTPRRDKCEICHGRRGGVAGNENRIDGKIVCDYCHADGSYKQALAVAVDGLAKKIAAGYESGTMTSDAEGLGGTIRLHYVSPSDAESAFNAISDAVDMTIAAQPAQAPAIKPVAIVDAGDGGMFAEIMPDVTVKVGQHLYAGPVPAGEPVATIIRDVAELDYTDGFDEEDMMAVTVGDLRLILERHIAAPVANAGQAQDDGQQHDDPTGPNHPGHHDGMTCERAAQVIVDLTEDQYPGSRGNFSNRIKRVYGESEYASWKPQAAQPTGGERAAFEAEMQRIGYNMTMEAKKPGQYAFPPMRAAWHAWQARAAIAAQQKP